MSEFLSQQVDFIHYLQRLHSPGMDGIFVLLSYLGEELTYLLGIGVLWLAVDWKLAGRVTVLLLISFYLNTLYKELLAQPRPFDVSNVLKLYNESGHGIPSGHAQSSFVFWVFLAWYTQSAWVRAAAWVLIPLIGLSRVYLGVHFPQDVLGGWGLGALLVPIFIMTFDAVERALLELPLHKAVFFIVGAPLILAVLFNQPNAVAATGSLVGVGLGTLLLNRSGGFNSEGPWSERILRSLVGVGIMIAIHFGLHRLSPPEHLWFYTPFRFVKYALVVFWISFGMPWFWKKIAVRDQVRSLS